MLTAPPSGHGERSRTISEIPRQAPCYGKLGSRSVDLPVRASSRSVARLLLLDADQRSTLRGAPFPLPLCAPRWPSVVSPPAISYSFFSRISLHSGKRAFRSFSSPLFFPEFMSSNSFPAPPHLPPFVSILLAHRSLGEGGCSSVVKFSSLVAAMPRCEPLYYNP